MPEGRWELGHREGKGLVRDRLSGHLWSPTVMVGRGLHRAKAKVVKITLLEHRPHKLGMSAAESDFQGSLRVTRSDRLPKVTEVWDWFPRPPPFQWPRDENATVKTSVI